MSGHPSQPETSGQILAGRQSSFRWTPMNSDEEGLERLLDRLPNRIAGVVRFLRKPSGRWLRLPAGLLLICGGVLGFLPLVGFWMLPIGLALLADDVPLLRSLRSRALQWIERHRPHWLQPEGGRNDPS